MRRWTVLFVVALGWVPLAAMIRPAGADPAALAGATSSPATVASCAVPGCDATAFVVAAIDGARSEIRGMAYGFTSAPIAAALTRAKARGVDVAALVDKTTPCERGSVVDALVAAGIPVAIDHAPRIAHNKLLVVDRKEVIEGSFNFTAGAMHNAENTNLVSSAALAAYYRAYWDRRQAESTSYADRGAWCRRP